MTGDLTGPMRAALQWLANGNEVTISLIEGHGYTAEMPRRSTLQALARRDLVEVSKYLGGFDVRINDAGRAALCKSGQERG